MRRLSGLAAAVKGRASMLLRLAGAASRRRSGGTSSVVDPHPAALREREHGVRLGLAVRYAELDPGAAVDEGAFLALLDLVDREGRGMELAVADDAVAVAVPPGCRGLARAFLHQLCRRVAACRLLRRDPKVLTGAAPVAHLQGCLRAVHLDRPGERGSRRWIGTFGRRSRRNSERCRDDECDAGRSLHFDSRSYSRNEGFTQARPPPRS